MKLILALKSPPHFSPEIESFVLFNLFYPICVNFQDNPTDSTLDWMLLEKYLGDSIFKNMPGRRLNSFFSTALRWGSCCQVIPPRHTCITSEVIYHYLGIVNCLRRYNLSKFRHQVLLPSSSRCITNCAVPDNPFFLFHFLCGKTVTNFNITENSVDNFFNSNSKIGTAIEFYRCSLCGVYPSLILVSISIIINRLIITKINTIHYLLLGFFSHPILFPVFYSNLFRIFSFAIIF